MPDPQRGKPVDSGIAIDSEELVRANIGWMLALAERLLRRLTGTMLSRVHGMITCREFEEFVLGPAHEPVPEDVPEDLIKAVLNSRK